MHTKDALTYARRRADEIEAAWLADQNTQATIVALDALSAELTANGSLPALISGAARLIEQGEAVEHRLEKLRDHLHGYGIGWSDAVDENGW